MRQPTAEEFEDLKQIIVEALDDDWSPDAVVAICEEWWPAEVVQDAIRELCQ